MIEAHTEALVGHVHFLKCHTEFFTRVIIGVKTLELRLDDRGYEVGDFLVQQDYEPDTLTYSGWFCINLVTDIVRGLNALVPGYVAMSVKLLHTGHAKNDEALHSVVKMFTGTVIV